MRSSKYPIKPGQLLFVFNSNIKFFAYSLFVCTNVNKEIQQSDSWQIKWVKTTQTVLALEIPSQRNLPRGHGFGVDVVHWPLTNENPFSQVVQSSNLGPLQLLQLWWHLAKKWKSNLKTGGLTLVKMRNIGWSGIKNSSRLWPSSAEQVVERNDKSRDMKQFCQNRYTFYNF